MPFRLSLAGLLCLLILPVGTPATDLDPAGDAEKAVLLKLFAPDAHDLGRFFHPSFLEQVPEPQMKQILDTYRGALGDLEQIVGSSGNYELVFTKGKTPCRITLNQQRQIVGLWFGHWTLFDDSPTSLREEFSRIPGQVSVTLVRDDGQTLFSLNSDLPLAVGSAFKLYVLQSAADQVRAGKMRWDQVVPLRADRVSLPSGILQNWPADSPLTLRTLANLMISISDNTATDHLLFLLGRERVEAHAPQRLRPFLSTREMFVLKWGVEADTRQRYAAADLAGRRQLLEKLQDFPLNKIAYDGSPVMVDEIEWHISTRELCRLIHSLRDDPSLAINTGLANPAQWHRIGYKGGSEPGVLNFTHLLQPAADGPAYALAATVNHTSEAIDTNGFALLVSRLMALLQRGEFSAEATHAP
ncbi:MAG: serine hydrolase [Acidobacteria bacterium]|nr:serine hydrolase [Acidobacteriota bacterium]